MVCFSPLKGYHSAKLNPDTGKRPVTFSGQKVWGPLEGVLLSLPCGECSGCRSDRAEAWGIRCTHEARMHDVVSGSGGGCEFWTLTYDNDHLPADNSLSKRVLQLFMKRVRHSLPKGVKIKFLGVGEYGDKRGRAHYHYIVFGHRFADRKLWKQEHGHKFYISETLAELWGNGFVLIGDVTFETANYCAAYSQKKVRGKKAVLAYRRRSPVDGKVYDVSPEFMLVSTKPGIGQSWFEKFKSDVFPSDEVIINGKRKKPPRYYEKMLSEDELEALKLKRRASHAAKAADRTPERLAAREQVHYLNGLRYARNVE